MTRWTGGCLCGGVRYEANGDPVVSLACHCRDCQYVSGGGPAYVMVFGRAAVSIKHGAPQAYVSVADSGTRVARLYCADCGTPLFAHNADHETHLAVKVGSLDDPQGFRPAGHIWTRSAQPWHAIDRALPCADANPF